MLFIAIILIVLAQLIDYASTRDAIERGAKEANPFVKAVGLVEAKLIGVATTILIVSLMPPMLGLVGAVGMLAFSIIIARHNLKEV